MARGPRLREAAECVAGLVGAGVAGSGVLRGCVREAVLYGSLVRGDYDPRISDVDLFLVLSDECAGRVREVLSLAGELLERASRGCLGAPPARGADVAWCLEGELPRGECDYKFLTLYRDDFEENSIIAWGRPLHRAAPRVPHEQAVCAAMARVRRRLREWAGTPLEAAAAGEAVKAALAASGYRGPWTKQAILEALEARGWRELAAYWRLYMEGRRPPRGEPGRIAEAALALARALLESRGARCPGEARARKEGPRAPRPRRGDPAGLKHRR